MYWDVKEAKIIGDLEFEVCFSDGTSGRVKILPSHLFGVFEKLKSPDFFRKLSVTDGFVSWPGEIDLAPDAMYFQIKQNGEWILK